MCFFYNSSPIIPCLPAPSFSRARHQLLENSAPSPGARGLGDRDVANLCGPCGHGDSRVPPVPGGASFQRFRENLFIFYSLRDGVRRSHRKYFFFFSRESSVYSEGDKARVLLILFLFLFYFFQGVEEFLGEELHPKEKVKLGCSASSIQANS